MVGGMNKSFSPKYLSLVKGLLLGRVGTVKTVCNCIFCIQVADVVQNEDI